MDDEGRVSASERVKPSYWLDACEDISCDDFIHDFVDDFGSSNTAVVPSAESLSATSSYHKDDVSLDPCFFGGIDQILDSIKNGGGLPPHPGSATLQNDHISAADITLPDGLPQDNNGNRNSNEQRLLATVIENNNNKNNMNNKNACNIRNFSCCEGDGDGIGDVDCLDAEERYGGPGKWARLGHVRRGLERPVDRKRTRGWDDMDSYRRDHLRRKELQKDLDRREARGYWERDKERNKMIFHLGSWEVDRNREGWMPTEKSCQSSGATDKKPEQPNGKYKLPEEQARQYQLDVLEQAKKEKHNCLP